MGVNGRAAGFALGYGVTMLVAMFAVQVHRRRRERQQRDVSVWPHFCKYFFKCFFNCFFLNVFFNCFFSFVFFSCFFKIVFCNVFCCIL